MKKVFSRIYPWLLLPMFVACVQIKDKERHVDATLPEFYVESTSTLNQYFVHLLPMESANEVRRQDLGRLDVKAAAIQLLNSNQEWVDAHVTAGSKYRYQYVDKFGAVLKTADVAIPLDLMIDRTMELSESPAWANLNRVYFTKSGMLITNGHKMMMHAQVIESDGGVIRTFSPGQTAEPSKSGRSGAEIRIFANEARGDLSIELRGESGGVGASPFFTARDGGDGGNGGDAGRMTLDIAQTNDLRITSFVNQAGVRGLGAKGTPAGMVMPICLGGGDCGGGTVVGAGSDGKDGKDGERGELCFAQAGRTLSCQQ